MAYIRNIEPALVMAHRSLSKLYVLGSYILVFVSFNKSVCHGGQQMDLEDGAVLYPDASCGATEMDQNISVLIKALLKRITCRMSLWPLVFMLQFKTNYLQM